MSTELKIRMDDGNMTHRNERLEAISKLQNSSKEASKIMDQELYNTTVEGDVDKFIDALESSVLEKDVSLSTIINQVSPSDKSLLHVAAEHGRKEIAALLARQFPFLITSKNFSGDTPLHVAARAGKLDTISVLIGGCATNVDKNRLLQIQNNKGNTALHETVMSGRFAETVCLVSVNAEVSYTQNNEGKSPLYLAAESGNKKILGHLLGALVKDGKSPEMLQGKSPLHAALEKKNSEVVKEIIEKMPKLIYVKDEKGGTPVHCAASIGDLGGLGLLLRENKLGYLDKNKEGLYPIHVACENGHIRVVKELLENWPDPTELLDNKGQNILHIAAKNGKRKVVRYILKTPKLDKLVKEVDNDGNTPLHLAAMHGHSLVVGHLVCDKRSNLEVLNNQGLTAYDVVEQRSMEAKSKNSVKPDLNEKKKRDDPIDRESLTTYDAAKKQFTISESQNSEEQDSIWMMMTLSILYVFHIWHARRTHEPLSKNLRLDIKPPKEDDVKDRIGNLIVVAVLIAGVSFAAAITMPGADSGGGGDSDSKNSTAAITAHNSISGVNPVTVITIPAPPPAPAGGSSNGSSGGNSNSGKNGVLWSVEQLKQSFIIFNTAAMNLSIMAAIILCWARFVDINLASFAVWAASCFVGIALYMMFLAFLTAVLIAAIKYAAFGTAILILEILFALAQTVVLVPLLIPFLCRQLFIRLLYLGIFCAYFSLYWLGAKGSDCWKK